MRVVVRIALLPVIAGISYEVLKLAGNSENALVNLLSKPGMAIQMMTTSEPDDDMIEVAIQAVEAVFDWRAYEREKFSHFVISTRVEQKKLEKAGIREAKLDAWYLLEYKTGISRAVFLADPDREVEEEKAESYQKDICTRARRIPLQHITGEQEFMGLNFKVNENVLVPRQDTEILVEEALKRIRPDMQILDMCTGSGCILESILKFGEKKQMHLKGTGAIFRKRH